MDICEKIAYIKGLAEGLALDETTKEGKILSAIIDLLGDITEEICDIDTATALKNTVLYAAREDFQLEEGDFFIADLIGLPVIDVSSGFEYGRMADVINRGASDIYVIRTSDGEKMMPAVSEFVKKIDMEKGIFVSPIEGMFD